jgi:uncharacterized protein YciI
MFVVLLRFAAKRSEAGRFMDGHKQWIAQGFDDGVFMLVGSLQGGLGGAVVAHNTTRADLERRVNADPFVAEDVVSAEILEITPSRIDERLQFMVA